MGAPVNCNTFTPASQLGKGTHCNVCLSTGQVLGLSCSVQAGFVSLFAVLFLFFVIVRRYRQITKSPPDAPWRLFRSNLDGFLLNLLFAEIIMSLGGIMDIEWINKRQVYCGSQCDVQGALQVIGETAVAMFTIAIAIHTFLSIWRDRRLSYSLTLWVTYSICAWAYVLIFAFVNWGLHKGQAETEGFFTPTPFWCWINSHYARTRYGEYVWLWVAGAGSIILYSLLALLLGGCFTNQDEEITEEQRELRREGWMQLLNPLGCTILLLPPTLVRWMYISRKDPPSVLDPNMSSLATATLVFHATFRLSGLINVLLVLGTRSGLLLVGSTGELYASDPRRQREERRTEREMGQVHTHLDRYSDPSRASVENATKEGLFSRVRNAMR